MIRREFLHMDYRKHVEYLPSTKVILARRLCERFGTEQGMALWEKTKRLYEGFVADMPYTGGSKNPMCNPDFDNMPELGIYLIRPKTVGMGYPVCDYRFVGDKSPAVKQYERVTDEKGFMYDYFKNRSYFGNNWSCG